MSFTAFAKHALPKASFAGHQDRCVVVAVVAVFGAGDGADGGADGGAGGRGSGGVGGGGGGGGGLLAEPSWLAATVAVAVYCCCGSRRRPCANLSWRWKG